MTETTFYRSFPAVDTRRKVYGGMSVSEASRLKELEKENAASNACWPSATWRWMPCRSTCKKSSRPGLRDALLAHLQQRGLSQRAACQYLGLNRATVRYTPRPDHNAALLRNARGVCSEATTARLSQSAWNALQRSGQKVSLEPRASALEAGASCRCKRRSGQEAQAARRSESDYSVSDASGASLVGGLHLRRPAKRHETQDADGRRRFHPRMSRH